MAAMVCSAALNAQLKTSIVCPAFNIDILGGTINDLKPNSSGGEIRKAFPCFTSVEDEGVTASCGGIIFYMDKDIYF